MTGPPDPLVARLRAAGCVYADDEAALLRAAAGTPADLEALVVRREAGEPLEVVVGHVDFCGVRVATAPGVFVPRARSGLLVRLAVAALPPGGVLVDLGCGTGALAAAVLARRPDARCWAVDLDPAAVACARRTLATLPPDRVREGDLWAALPTGAPGPDLRGRVDVAVVNAPYVPTSQVALLPPEARDHEHRLALDGGPDGLDVQRRVADGAGSWLAPAGRVVVETGRHQAAATAALLGAAGLRAGVEVDDDLAATAVVGLARSNAG